MSNPSTDRRSFLKTGALAATPVIALAPAAAMADDGGRARLARLEDERAIKGLTRAFLRRFNGGGASKCGEFVASSGAIKLDNDLDAIVEDPAQDTRVELSEDGNVAHLRRACRVERVSHFEGATTLEQMARFQGQGTARHSESRILDAQFARRPNGWIITRLRLA